MAIEKIKILGAILELPAFSGLFFFDSDPALAYCAVIKLAAEYKKNEQHLTEKNLCILS